MATPPAAIDKARSLKRRRKTSKAAPLRPIARKKTPLPPIARKKQPKKTKQKPPPNLALGFCLLFCYLPILIFINPMTAARWMGYLYGEPECLGICSVDTLPQSHSPTICGPFDTERLVYIRIPKTASTTLLELFAKQRKPIALVDLGELEDLVSSIPHNGSVAYKQFGYHDATSSLPRKRQYYKDASKKILFPPFTNQRRSLFQGHLHYFDFQTQAPRYYPNSTSLIPPLLQRLYNIEYPQAPLFVPQITLIRNPQTRLASMYSYDRHETRTAAWRNEFALHYGNSSFEQCLESENCILQNSLTKWCNIQTLILCGAECVESDEEANLQTALDNIENKFLWTGVMERLPESLQLLKKQLPTFIEVLPHPLPRSRKSSVKREAKLSEKAQAKLNDICQYDMQLHAYANALLTERLGQCA